MSQPYRYRLTLEAVDHGTRCFEAERECESQDEMERAVSYDISLALEACLNCPPTGFDLLAARHKRGLPHGIGIAVSRFWDASANYEDALTVSIDIGVLMGDCELTEQRGAAKLLRLYGITITGLEAEEEATE